MSKLCKATPFFDCKNILPPKKSIRGVFAFITYTECPVSVLSRKFVIPPNDHSPFLYHLERNREIDLIRDFSIQPPLQLTVHFSKPEIRTVIQSCWSNKNCFSMRFLYFPHLLSAKIKIHCFLCHSMLLYNKELYFTFCKKSVNSLFTGCK